MTTSKIDVWQNQTVQKYHSAALRMFPTEYILRALISNSYFSIQHNITAGMKILDIGCLYANNLVPFYERGLLTYGLEINEEMVRLAENAANVWNIKPEIRKGTNREIPYPDSFFDVVLSIHTIHYEDDLNDIRNALKEFLRVGRDNCCFLISTVGKGHIYHKTAVREGQNRYRLHTDEFRNGQIMSYFDNESHFESVLKDHFSNVEVAVISETWPKNPMEFYVAKCLK